MDKTSHKTSKFNHSKDYNKDPKKWYKKEEIDFEDEEDERNRFIEEFEIISKRQQEVNEEQERRKKYQKITD